MFDQPGFLGLILGIAAVATLADVWRGRVELFDERVTGQDRQRLQRLVIFVLLPVSVLLHEAGHAAAVKLFGGEVIGFGFYIVYGYVEHQGLYTPLELGLIAVAGTLVNVVLGLGAVALAWFWPRRAAINYLLFVFAAFELGNALIFYPVIDALGGISGDWETIYSRDTPIFSAGVAVVHLTIVAGAVLLWRNPRFQAGYAKRVGRRVPPQPLTAEQRRDLSELLAQAADEALQGWSHRVQKVADAQAGGTQLVLRWESGGYARALLAHAVMAEGAPRIELHAMAQPQHPGAPRLERPLARFSGEPNVPELARNIRRFLEYVDTWSGVTQITPN